MRKQRNKWTAMLIAGTMVFGGGYVTYASEEQTKTAAEAVTEADAEPKEILWDEMKVLYMTDDVYVHEAADYDSKAIAVAYRGDAIVVIGECGDWYIINLSIDPETVEQKDEKAEASQTEEAVEAESEQEQKAEEENSAKESDAVSAEQTEETPDQIGYLVKRLVTDKKEEADQAVAAQEAALAAARAAEAAASYATQEQQPSGRYVTGKQYYDDCDGSGHGYCEVYYSDGTMEIVEY